MTAEKKNAAAGRRGRPVVLPPAARQKRIFDALEALYRENGLDGASMDALASRAGMSKRTIYAMFPSRAALLRSYLEQVAGGFVRPLPPAARTLPLADRLRRILSPGERPAGYGLPLEILRHIIAELPAAPGIGRDFLERSTEVYRRILAEELERGRARGEIAVEDTEAAAALLLDMVRPWPLETLLDPVRLPDEATLAARLELAVEVFLHGVARHG